MVLSIRTRLFTACILFLSVASAQAEVLFEGYSKIIASGTPVGYIIQRFDFDSKKQEFSSIYLLHTKEVTESLKARATASLKPVAYQYTSLVAGKAKTIDATFTADEMTATIREGTGAPSVSKKKIPKEAFLGMFLNYIMLQGKEGIKPGVSYGYKAIAEEDATVNAGEANIVKEEVVNGISTFRVLNTFKGAHYVFNITTKGETIATESPVQRLSTEVVASLHEAVGGMSFNSNSVKALFGSVPKGLENAIARKASSAPVVTIPAASSGTDDTTETSSAGTASPSKKKILTTPEASDLSEPKKQGVPGGNGMNLKPVPKK
jgi:hypothetical protein